MFVITAFDELCSERPVGFGSVGAIPWSAIDRYAERHRFADDDVAYDDFVHHIRALDDVFIKAKLEEQKREDKKREFANRVRGGHAGNRANR